MAVGSEYIFFQNAPHQPDRQSLTQWIMPQDHYRLSTVTWG